MKKWIYRIILVICVGVFCFSAYNLWNIYSQKHQITKETEKLKEKVVKKKKTASKERKNVLSPDWDALKKENENIVAWLYVPDCEISFPVVQGNDNKYYLNHTVDKEYNIRGSIFLDAHANPSFSDDNSIIYGHSVQDGGMFTLLKNYCDEQFFNSHKVFYLLTPQANYKCNVLAFSKTIEDSAYYTTSFGDYRQDTIASMLQLATFSNSDVDTSTGSFVTLSTCNLDYGFNSNHRFVLVGHLEPTNDDIEIVD